MRRLLAMTLNSNPYEAEVIAAVIWGIVAAVGLVATYLVVFVLIL